MSDRTTKTKAELLKMLAEAVRNTQPQPMGPAHPEPIRDVRPKRKKAPVPKRTAKIKRARASASRKQRRR